jgi:N-methylhydantoinase B
MVESYGFVENSGGPGRHRGGLGLRRVVRPIGHTMVFNGQGERFVNSPWGLFGGGPGGTGRFLKCTGTTMDRLPTKPMSVEITPEEAVVIETPGAGGYGPSAERSKAALRNDFVSGKFDRDFLLRWYAYDPLADREAAE